MHNLCRKIFRPEFLQAEYLSATDEIPEHVPSAIPIKDHILQVESVLDSLNIKNRQKRSTSKAVSYSYTLQHKGELYSCTFLASLALLRVECYQQNDDKEDSGGQLLEF